MTTEKKKTTKKPVDKKSTEKKTATNKKQETLYDKLSRPLPIEGIQRTSGSQTKKGYDTTGYGYQYIVNRFNDVLGIGGWNWKAEVIHEEQGKFQSGAPYVEITAAVTITIYGEKEVSHTEYGGHRAGNYADAIKGASTNGLKKCAAFFGVGKEAYEGTIDDDNQSVGAPDEEKVTDGTEKKPVTEIIKQMEEELNIDNIDAWEAGIAMKPGYTKTQRRVMQLKLEEIAKKKGIITEP